MFSSSEIRSDFASIVKFKEWITCHFKNLQRFSLDPHSRCLLCSVIPIFTLETIGLRNEGSYVDKSQKLWKLTPLFTQLPRSCSSLTRFVSTQIFTIFYSRIT